MLSTPEIRKFYNRIGRLQDSQAFYENRAIEELIAHANFGEARSVFEFGCGTGRVAGVLLQNYLAADCHYRGVDLSETMVRLARQRLVPWRERAEVLPIDGSLHLPAADRFGDCFLATYVFDLLSDETIGEVLAEAGRVLTPKGRLCLVSLTHGTTGIGRLVSGLWSRVQGSWPKLVGGCRPIELLQYLPSAEWKIEHRGLVTRFAVASEIVVATRIR